ncbi:PqqD family protein [uncultured Acetobacteroides sp.]|uniref:PqqD family protein n=1 Tax=uncultured Acetobacteroides sp. TaxID=1760811 RepID=UPI0029F4DADB|nr:PqqD family protein [uncultured Acetobacteroides sp.]
MKVKPSVVINDTGFVFNPETGDSFSVNTLGLELIRQLEEERDVETLRKFLSRKFTVSMATLRKDLDDFLRMLKDNKIIE